MITYNNKKDTYIFGNKNTIDFFISVSFVVTRRCVLRCIHCFEKKSIKEARLTSIKKIIDKLPKRKLSKICITGGEPLIRKDIVDILKYVHNKGIAISFSTNGMLLNKTKLLEIKPFIDSIRLSIHGNEKNHDSVTLKKGSFKKVIECLKITSQLKIPAVLMTTVMKKNLYDLPDIFEICDKYNVSKLYLFSLVPTGRGKRIYNKEYISPKIISDETLKNSKKISSCHIKIVDWSIEGQCILIYENGNVVAQPSYEDKGNRKIVGNLLKDSPECIWKNYPFKKEHIKYYMSYH
jgi:MoaA/NifB/PqqE/SkfB family radical SAM enzyme